MEYTVITCTNNDCRQKLRLKVPKNKQIIHELEVTCPKCKSKFTWIACYKYCPNCEEWISEPSYAHFVASDCPKCRIPLMDAPPTLKDSPTTSNDGTQQRYREPQSKKEQPAKGGFFGRLFGRNKNKDSSQKFEYPENETMTVYAFFMRFKGTRLENDRFMLASNAVDKWTTVIREDVDDSSAKVVLFDITEWDCPSVHIARIEQNLPGIQFGIDVQEAVRKALRARSVPEQNLDRIIESESRVVVRSNVNGYVIFLFSPHRSPVLYPQVRGFP